MCVCDCVLGSINYSKRGTHKNHERAVVNGPSSSFTDSLNYFNMVSRVQSSHLSDDVVELEITLHR